MYIAALHEFMKVVVMVASLKELLSQRAALEQQIIEARRAEKTDAISKIRDLMTEYGLTLADLQSGSRSVKRPGSVSKVPAKYIDKASGSTWSGRGLQPRWLRQALADGRKLADFAV